MKIRDEREAVKTAVKLGIPVQAPQQAAKKAKTTVAAVIKRWAAILI